MNRIPLLGLALGGGGARGLAHIGILKVFEDEGIQPGVLSGTSMGGIVASLYASGMTAKEIEEEARQKIKLSGMIKLLNNDLTNLHYVFGSRSIQDYLSGLLGDKKEFDDLDIPLALAAVDMKTGREVALDQGNLAEAINATVALPGIIEPVEKDGMRLADGGTLNNVPSDFVRSMGAEKVIAVDVHPGIADETFWQGKNIPEVAAVNWRSEYMKVAAITAAKQRRAETDLIIKPDIPSSVSTLAGFNQFDQIVEAGVKAALDAMPEIRKLLRPRFYVFHAEIKPAEPMQL